MIAKSYAERFNACAPPKKVETWQLEVVVGTYLNMVYIYDIYIIYIHNVDQLCCDRNSCDLKDEQLGFIMIYPLKN